MTTALVTGANRGIGLQLAKQLRERKVDVIAVVRKASPELETTGARIEAGVDLGRDDAAAEVARRLEGASIDLLIHNAGILAEDKLGKLDADEIRRVFEVNSVAPLRLTEALLPRLGKGSKVAIVTSRMGSIADNTSGGYYAYRISKAAVNMAGRSLAWDLKPRGVAVFLLHPGYVKTEMNKGGGDISPEESAAGMLKVLDRVGLAETGTFWHTNGQGLSW
jgi:NAD(P)-dependent dehydrogenase (short-subunit alcohol dehydrogenase family)